MQTEYTAMDKTLEGFIIASFGEAFYNKVIEITQRDIEVCQISGEAQCRAIFLINLVTFTTNVSFTDESTKCLIELICCFFTDYKGTNDCDELWLSLLLAFMLEGLCLTNASFARKNHSKSREWLRQNDFKLQSIVFCEPMEYVYNYLTAILNVKCSRQFSHENFATILLLELVSANVIKFVSRKINNVVVHVKEGNCIETSNWSERCAAIIYLQLLHFKLRYSIKDEADHTHMEELQPILLEKLVSKSVRTYKADRFFCEVYEERWGELEESFQALNYTEVFAEWKKQCLFSEYTSLEVEFLKNIETPSEIPKQESFDRDTVWDCLGEACPENDFTYLKQVSEEFIAKSAFPNEEDECKLGITIAVIMTQSILVKFDAQTIFALLQLCWRYFEHTKSCQSKESQMIRLLLAYLLESLFLLRGKRLEENSAEFSQWLISNQEDIKSTVFCEPLNCMIQSLAKSCGVAERFGHLKTFQKNALSPKTLNMYLDLLVILLNKWTVSTDTQAVNSILVVFLLIVHQTLLVCPKQEHHYVQPAAFAVRELFTDSTLKEFAIIAQQRWQVRFADQENKNIEAKTYFDSSSFFTDLLTLTETSHVTLKDALDALILLCQSIVIPVEEHEAAHGPLQAKSGKSKMKLGKLFTRSPNPSIWKRELTYDSLSSDFYKCVETVEHCRLQHLIDLNLTEFAVSKEDEIATAGIILMTLMLAQYAYEQDKFVTKFILKRSWLYLAKTADCEEDHIKWYRYLVAYLLYAYCQTNVNNFDKEKIELWIKRNRSDFGKMAFCPQLARLIRFLCKTCKEKEPKFSEKITKLEVNENMKKVASTRNAKLINFMSKLLKQVNNTVDGNQISTCLTGATTALYSSILLAHHFSESDEATWGKYGDLLKEVKASSQKTKQLDVDATKELWQEDCKKVLKLKTELEDFFGI